MMSRGQPPSERSRADAVPARYAELVLGAQLHRGDVSGLFIATRPGVPGAPVALARLLHKHVESSGEHRALVEREASLGPLFASPHLVAYTPVLQSAPHPFALLELVEGLSLAQLIARTEDRLETPRLLLLAIVDVLRGLAELHRTVDADGPLGLVQQAPVPRHVLVGVDGVARLTDFTQCVSRRHPWVSAIASRLAAHELAPEQALAPTHVDARCDLFIASATAFSVLAGRPLFAAPDPEQAVQRVLRMPVPSFTELGISGASRLERLLLRGLARARADRPGSAAEMADELAAAAAQAGLLATREELAAHVHRARRARMLVASAAEPARPSPVPASAHPKTLLGVAALPPPGGALDASPPPPARHAGLAVDLDAPRVSLPVAPIVAVVVGGPERPRAAEEWAEATEAPLLLERPAARPWLPPEYAGSTVSGLGPALPHAAPRDGWAPAPAIGMHSEPAPSAAPAPAWHTPMSPSPYGQAAGRGYPPRPKARSRMGALAAVCLLVGGAGTGFALVRGDLFDSAAETEELADLERRVRALAQQGTQGEAQVAAPARAEQPPAPALQPERVPEMPLDLLGADADFAPAEREASDVERPARPRPAPVWPPARRAGAGAPARAVPATQAKTPRAAAAPPAVPDSPPPPPPAPVAAPSDSDDPDLPTNPY